MLTHHLAFYAVDSGRYSDPPKSLHIAVSLILI